MEMKGGRMVARIAQVVERSSFQGFILAVIALNSIVIGAATYPSVVEHFGATLELLDRAFLAIFVVEIVLRIAAHGDRPLGFLRSGWNVFDFTIVLLALLPALFGPGVTVLRALRIVRVLRLISAFRDLRIIVAGMVRSLAPLTGVALLMLLLVYVYAVIGTTLFGDLDPEGWGQVGAATLSVFRILTLENWDEIYFAVAGAGPAATIYFVSFIIIATLVVLNLVIAVFVSSVEQARVTEIQAEVRELSRSFDEQAPALSERISELHEALDLLENEIRGGRAAQSRHEGGVVGD